MLLHMLVSFIDIINYFIHHRLVGVLQCHHAQEWIDDVVHHMALVE